LKRYLDEKGAAVEPLVVTVDHRLRAESAAETRRVAEIAAGLGLEHRTLAWQGPKPATGVSAAAREARHLLLAQAANEGGSDMVLTGHTMNDQAETVLMRRARGTGRGEAGIAPATLFESRCWFVRPLLGARRDELRGFLASAGQGWIDDPTNADPHYERARMREALSRDEVMRLAAQADAAARERAGLGAGAARLIAAHADMPAPGLVRLDRAFADATEREAAGYALRILLAATGGSVQLPDAARGEALFARLGEVNFRATLSRSVIDCRRAAVFLMRERRGLPAPLPFATGIWDGRFRIGGEAHGELAPAGADGAPADERAGVPPSLAAAAGATRPALRPNGKAVLLDEAGDGAAARARPVVAPWARYLPSFDLAPARAAAILFGADEIPPPPFARRNGPDA
jgi:tRNA(Ile)-lysidine synthase